MSCIQSILKNNHVWEKQKKSLDHHYFTQLSQGQSPHCLWIGCSDSRCTPEILTNSPLGSFFVHRNIANQCLPSDINLNAIIEFALTALGIQTIFVVGHTQCGGIQAALSTDPLNQHLETWIHPLKQLYEDHKKHFSSIHSQQEKERLLCQLNIMTQITQLSHHSRVQDIWMHAKHPLTLHGLLFELETGQLIDINTTIKSRADTENLQKKFDRITDWF